jgi:cell division septation protein DedD
MLRSRAVSVVRLSIAVIFTALLLGGQSSSAGDAPGTYVEGARSNASEQRMSETDLIDACVPYSETRSDVLICGPVPEGFRPGGPPGVYPEVCTLAEREYAQRPTSNADLDPSTCYVTPTDYLPGSPPERAEYLVTFESADGTEHITVPLSTES